MSENNNNHEEVDFLSITNEEGEEEKFEILHEFDHPSNGYRYILLIPFLDAEEGSEVEADVYPVRYKIQENEHDQPMVETLETEEEWNLVEEELRKLYDDYDNNNEEN